MKLFVSTDGKRFNDGEYLLFEIEFHTVRYIGYSVYKGELCTELETGFPNRLDI